MVDRRTVRCGLAVVSVLVVVVILAVSAMHWRPSGPVKDYLLTELLQAAVELKVEQSRSEFHLTLLALGALLGLMIAKKDEAAIVLADGPEIVMFSCASLMLVASALSHLWYVETISYVYWVAGTVDAGRSIPDTIRSGVNNPFQFQFWSLLGGMSVAAMALFSAHRLK